MSHFGNKISTDLLLLSWVVWIIILIAVSIVTRLPLKIGWPLWFFLMYGWLILLVPRLWRCIFRSPIRKLIF